MQEKLGEEEAAEVKRFGALGGGCFHLFQMWRAFKNTKIEEMAVSAHIQAPDAFCVELEKKTLTKAGAVLRQFLTQKREISIGMHGPWNVYFKPSKDQVTLNIGGNANGDEKLKYILVYRSRLHISEPGRKLTYICYL